MKDFDAWNKEKQCVHKSDKNQVYFNEREVWWCELGVNIGFEQDGKGEKFQRPIVILKKYNKHALLVIPLTTKQKKGKYYKNVGCIDSKSATVFLSQVKFIDSKRLLKKIETLPHIMFDAVKKAIIEVNF